MPEFPFRSLLLQLFLGSSLRSGWVGGSTSSAGAICASGAVVALGQGDQEKRGSPYFRLPAKGH